MHGANLIPAHRIITKKRRKRLRRWVGGCVTYCLVLIGAYGLCHAALGGDDMETTGSLQESSRQISQAKRTIASLTGQLTEVRTELAANRAVGNQPDWSILLAAIAGSLGDDIFLQACQLRPKDSKRTDRANRDKPSQGAPELLAAGQRRYVLTVDGYGRSHAAMSRFMLRLESNPLFDEVKLVQNVRQPLLATHAIAFQIRCSFGTSEAGPK